ncbi:MAG TPA: c-type cytochrome [Pirellulales bacterium]|jgi:putative heme-binding domain-containing protein|nr:c-type cytochrome [Pirellulales bacterium]
MRFAAILGCCLSALLTLSVAGAARGDDDNHVTQQPEIALSVTAGQTPTPPEKEIPRDAFHLLPGFQVERLFTVPKDKFGSWVSMTIDAKGRIIAGNEGGSGLFRLTPPPIGSKEPTRVERLDVHLGTPMGLLFAFDSLYLTRSGDSALYRLRDTNGDDQFDEITKLKDLHGAGDHGPHALRLSPDGKQIYLLAGNFTALPIEVQADAPQRMGGVRTGQRHAKVAEGGKSRVLPNWDEDLLLPRQWDAGGFAVGTMAPGGWIAATDPDGKNWELLTVGFRNAYDMAMNADGELMTYDADMEWDIGTPWYRPTRILHAVAGADFGWRSGTGKWPAYRVDSLPAAVDVGPGSPVGVEFGYGAKFPAKYQHALFALDWTFGTIYAVHLTPDGASYTGTKEQFLARTPLPLTDTAVGPDGALYFTTGGRNTQSEVYRVTYIGGESTAPVDARDTKFAELRALRKKTEAPLDGQESPADAATRCVALLSHADQHIRHAARVSLERLPANLWQDRVLSATDPDTVIGGVVGLAHTVESPAQPALLAALDRLDFGKLSPRQQLDLLRAWSLAFIRLGAPEATFAAGLAAKLDPFYPATTATTADAAQHDALNRELCDMLVFLKSPTVLAKTIALIKQPTASAPAAPPDANLAELAARNPNFGKAFAANAETRPDTQALSYIFSLRNLREGWTPADRTFYFTFLRDEHKKQGGHSFQKFLDNIAQEAYDNATDVDRLVVDTAGLHEPYKIPEIPAPVGPGKEYAVDELITISTARPAGRNFAAGKRSFAAARCVVCHRFAGDGGSTGPDLTQAAGRFNLRDLSESIVDPSKVVSDQYRTVVVQTTAGQQYVGRVIGETDDSITVLTNPEDSTKWVQIAKADVESRSLSPVSLMPKNLLNGLNSGEVLDLLAYLLSRGNPDDPMFKP